MKFFTALLRLRPLLRNLRGIREALERANTLKEAELRALEIDYPPLKPITGKEAEIEVMWTDPEEIEREMYRQKMQGVSEE